MRRNFCFITTALMMCSLFFFSILAGVGLAQTPSGYVTRRDYHQNFDPLFQIDGNYALQISVSRNIRVDQIVVESTLSSAGAMFNIRVTRPGIAQALAEWSEYVSSTIPKVYTHQAIVENPNAGLFPDGGTIQIIYSIAPHGSASGTTGILDELRINLNSAKYFDSGVIPACSDYCSSPGTCDPDFCDPILDPGIKAWAIINTDEVGPIDALWYLGGCQKNISGTCNSVVWGYFYANPDDVSWGNINNPEVFAKIWFDESGRIDVNFFHVSVPNIDVYSSYGSPDEDSILDETGTTTSGTGIQLVPVCDGASCLGEAGTVTLGTRYIRHSYERGGSASEEIMEDGCSPPGYWPNANPGPNAVSTPLLNLGIGAVINSVQGPMDAIWREMGQSFAGDDGWDHVVWGYFYADRQKVTWGNINNPELFVKIWYDHAGRVDVNFFHVSVPDIEVYSTEPVPVPDPVGDYADAGMTTMDNRYVRFEYYSGTTPWPSPWP